MRYTDHSQRRTCVAETCQVSDTRSVILHAAYFYPQRIFTRSALPRLRAFPYLGRVEGLRVRMAHFAIRIENFERGAFALPDGGDANEGA